MQVSALTGEMFKKTAALEGCLATAAEIDDVAKAAHYYRDGVFEAMGELRETADKLESVVDKEAWPFPTYGDLLFSVR